MSAYLLTGVGSASQAEDDSSSAEKASDSIGDLFLDSSEEEGSDLLEEFISCNGIANSPSDLNTPERKTSSDEFTRIKEKTTAEDDDLASEASEMSDSVLTWSVSTYNY